MFALSAIPVFGLMSAAIDLSRASRGYAGLQAVVDAEALALAVEISANNSTDISGRANSRIRAQLKNSDLTNLSVAATMNTKTVTVSASATLQPISPTLMGVSPMTITGTATAVWKKKKLEVALVLDNTGSMAGAKITNLKTAAKSLISILQAVSAEPGAVNIAVIPFDTRVNIGTTTISSTLIDFSAQSKSTWNGCVIDRNQPYDTDDTPPTAGISSTYYPARNCALASLLPLTNNWTALNAKIDQMQASGNTNLTIGLVWGLHALTASDPLNQAKTLVQEPDLDKVMILLTDGENTQNRWTTNPSSIDYRTSIVCQNIKAAGIKLYTIRVVDGNETLLKACATDTSYYYNAATPAAMIPAFNDIAGRIGKLRLQK